MSLYLVLSYTDNFGIPMGSYCIPLIADLFLFCFNKSDFMVSLPDEKEAEIIQAFNSTT